MSQKSAILRLVAFQRFGSRFILIVQVILVLRAQFYFLVYSCYIVLHFNSRSGQIDWFYNFIWKFLLCVIVWYSGFHS